MSTDCAADRGSREARGERGVDCAVCIIELGTLDRRKADSRMSGKGFCGSVSVRRSRVDNNMSK